MCFKKKYIPGRQKSKASYKVTFGQSAFNRLSHIYIYCFYLYLHSNTMMIRGVQVSLTTELLNFVSFLITHLLLSEII